MNWKTRYAKPEKGDIVRMMAPCKNCFVNGVLGRNNCWERGYKDTDLLCTSDCYKSDHKGTVIDIKSINDPSYRCYTEIENLVKVK